MGRGRGVAALAGAAFLLLAACGGEDPAPPSSGDTSTSPHADESTPAVPTPEELAAALVTEDDLDGRWTVNVPPDSQAAVPGVVPESQQDMLPSIELCARASDESRSAAAALRWQAFRQLDQTEEDPIDLAGGDRAGHLVFVQEFLLAEDPADVKTTFDALRDGLRACQGRIHAGEEGPGRSEPMPVPDVGDDRYGELRTVTEAGGTAYWLLHNTLVRQGSTLMGLQVVDIVMGQGAQPVFTTEDIATFVTTAVEGLP